MKHASKLTSGLCVALVQAFTAYTLSSPPASAAPLLVRDGQPQAQIIVAEQPTRTAKLAATELQRFVARISGATLPIGTAPTADAAIRIYVGRSPGTDGLKLTDNDLHYGAFRIVTGDDWLAFLGDDKDYVTPEPLLLDPNNKENVARAMVQWDAKSGGTWGHPITSDHRLYSPLLDLWAADGRGSINAVYHFLKTLGVRWYYPDESGLIVPALKNIEMPKVDMVSRPDFPMRDFLVYGNEFFYARPGIEAMADRIKWQCWLGLNSDVNILGHSQGHGTMAVICRKEMKEAHPEYYALKNGERAVEWDSYGVPCLSSQGLFEQNVRYVRAVYDVLGEPMYSVAPSDGYTLCGCPLCKGKDSPERGFKGSLSDYVWEYFDRVARELYKTHPERKVQCIAYCPYQLPPTNIVTFSPNVVVGICQWRSLFYDDETRDYFHKLRRDWLAKLPSKTLWTWDYYLHGWENRSAWVHIPTFFPHLISEDMRNLKGISLGDHTDVVDTRPNRLEEFGDAMSVNHLNAYVTAACLWDAETDVDALLDEYYKVYFGPAANEMKTFMEYAEANWMKATKDYTVIDRFFELIEPAKRMAGDSIYGIRIARLDHYMQGMHALRARLAKGREGTPELQAPALAAGETMTVDGTLDEPFWSRLPAHKLVDVATGAAPRWGTSFKVAWDGTALCLGIVCQDPDTANLNITTRDPRSPAVWDGDNVEILLETPTHAYYQIAINPAGSVAEADRRISINTDWHSGAQVAAAIGTTAWTVEIRIPVAGEDAAAIDPMNGVSGKRPTAASPWYVNVCRMRERATSHELSCFSPTGKPNFHDTLKFAVLSVP